MRIDKMCRDCDHCDLLRTVTEKPFHDIKRYYCFDGDVLSPTKLTAITCSFFVQRKMSDYWRVENHIGNSV